MPASMLLRFAVSGGSKVKGGGCEHKRPEVELATDRRKGLVVIEGITAGLDSPLVRRVLEAIAPSGGETGSVV